MADQELGAPILVVVAGGRYECYAEGTPRDLELIRILQEDLGGVSDTVPDGSYHFNVEIIEGTQAYASLDPVP